MAIAGAFAVMIALGLVAALVAAVGYTVDRLLGFGFPAAGIAMLSTLAIVLGLFIGIMECRSGRGR